MYILLDLTIPRFAFKSHFYGFHILNVYLFVLCSTRRISAVSVRFFHTYTFLFLHDILP